MPCIPAAFSHGSAQKRARTPPRERWRSNENLIFTGLRGQERRDIYGEMLRRATSELPELTAWG